MPSSSSVLCTLTCSASILSASHMVQLQHSLVSLAAPERSSLPSLIHRQTAACQTMTSPLRGQSPRLLSKCTFPCTLQLTPQLAANLPLSNRLVPWTFRPLLTRPASHHLLDRHASHHLHPADPHHLHHLLAHDMQAACKHSMQGICRSPCTCSHHPTSRSSRSICTLCTHQQAGVRIAHTQSSARHHAVAAS